MGVILEKVKFFRDKMLIHVICDECGKDLKPQKNQEVFSMKSNEFCKECYQDIFCNYEY